MQELLQRTRIEVSKRLVNDEQKDAFISSMYTIYLHIYKIIYTYMTTKRLHLTAWHLIPQRQYLAYQFIELKKMFDTIFIFLTLLNGKVSKQCFQQPALSQFDK